MKEEELFSIVITTKNRKDDLSLTLKKLIELNLEGIEIVIIDDGSDVNVFDDLLIKSFKKSIIFKNPKSVGLIENRNRLARISNKKFIISLDDDSCFDVRPDFKIIAELFENNSDVVGLQLNCYDIKANEEPVSMRAPYQVQSYTGCGHILDREKFNFLGGYKSWFLQMCEERDFCQRAFKQGYKVLMFPGLPVCHRRTPVARRPERNTYHLVRNTLVYTFLNYPLIEFFIKLILIAPYFGIKYKTLGLVLPIFRGLVDGFFICIKRRGERSPISWAKYSFFKKLPIMR